jgi:hypothetical protein
MSKEKPENIKSIPKKGTPIFKWILVICIVLVIFSVIRFNMEESFITNARINASEENHSRAKDMIAAIMTKCSTTTGGKVTVGTTYINCNVSNSVSGIVAYFDANEWRNPHDAKQYCCAKSSSNPPLQGAPNTHIYATSDTEITIKTNIGTMDGDNKWLTSIVSKKYP